MPILQKPKGSTWAGAAGHVQARNFTEALTSPAGFSFESSHFASDLVSAVNEANSSFESALAEVERCLGFDEDTDQKLVNGNWSGKSAAAALYGMAGDSAAYMKMLSSESRVMAQVGSKVSDDDIFAGTMPSYGGEFKDLYSTESFDNQTTGEFMGVSIALAYTTGEQSPGMEAIYRTIALTPEQGGADVTVPILYVSNQVRHDTNGAPADWGLRRVLDAGIDPSILVDNATTLWPQYNDDTADNFAPESAVTPWEEDDGRRTVTTSALKVGRLINILSLGHQDVVSKNGTPNYSDALDRNVGVREVYFTLGSDVFSFDVSGIPFSRWVKGPEQGLKKLVLIFPLGSVELNGNSKTASNGEPTAAIFEDIRDQNLRVRLQVTLNGEVDLERGVLTLNPGPVSVRTVLNAEGTTLTLTSGIGAAIVSALAAIKVDYFTVNARVTNSNHRHLGLMLNMRGVTERLFTRVRAPLFIPYPVGEDRDQKLLDYLTWAIQTQKEAIGLDTLIEWHKRTMELTGGLRGEMTPGDFEENLLQIEGIGRYLINPYVQTLEVDVTNSQSLETTTAVANGQERILNVLRSLWFDIMQRTNYDAAARYTDGGQIVRKYNLTLLTSDTLKRFLSVNGDTRTLGSDVPFKLFSNVNKRLIDADEDLSFMYIVMTREGDDIDPLNAGVLLQTPSLVSSLTVTRDNSHRKELVVQPRYAYANLCPIVVKLEVKGAHELLKETIPFKVQNQVIDGTPGNGGDDEPGNGGDDEPGTGDGDSGAGGG